MHELGISSICHGYAQEKKFNSMCQFNNLLSEETYRYIYVDVASNMSCENVLRSDGVHLNRYELPQLKSHQ